MALDHIKPACERAWTELDIKRRGWKKIKGVWVPRYVPKPPEKKFKGSIPYVA